MSSLKYRITRNNLLSKTAVIIYSLIIAASTAAGIFFDRGKSLQTMKVKGFAVLILCTLAAVPILSALINLLCGAICSRAKKEFSPGKETEPAAGIYKKYFPVSFVIIMACWAVVWLAYYPGLFNYDVGFQIDQFLTGEYNTQYPLIHTLLLGKCYQLGAASGNPEAGLILYEVIQCSFCAFVFSLTCTFIRSTAKTNFLYYPALAFYALFPVHSILALSTTKDVLFSAFILLSILILFELKRVPQNRYRLMLSCMEVISLMMVLLLRNNAIFCLAAVLIIILPLPVGNKQNAVVILLASISLYFCLNQVMIRTLSAESVPLKEALSIPAQQFGRIYQIKGESDRESGYMMYQYLDPAQGVYDPHISDRMKYFLKISRADQLPGLLDVSFRLFMKYKAISLDSLLYTNEGLWYLWDTSHADIYPGLYRGGYLLTYIEDGYGISPDSKLPALERFLEKLVTENEYQKIPLVSLIFAPAFYVYLFLFSFFVLISKKKYSCSPYPYIYLSLFFLLLTIIAGPCILIRYLYPFAAVAPVFIWLMFKSAGS